MMQFSFEKRVNAVDASPMGWKRRIRVVLSEARTAKCTVRVRVALPTPNRTGMRTNLRVHIVRREELPIARIDQEAVGDIRVPGQDDHARIDTNGPDQQQQ